LDTNNLNENTTSDAVVAGDAQNSNTGKRRRRRRRNKGGVAQAGQANGEFKQPNGESGEVASVQASADPSVGDATQGQGAGSGRRRKRNRRKKNKQQGEGQPQQQAQQSRPRQQSNEPNFNRMNSQGGHRSANGNGGGRRRDRRGKGGGGFVGPMDHSYRASDNLADSTVGVNGNFRPAFRQNNNGQMVNGNIASYAETMTVPIREDAAVRVFGFIDDLFFHAKIRETAKAVGIRVEFVKNEKETIERVVETAADHPILVVVDLNNVNAKPIPLIKKLRAKMSKASSIVGFVSHVQGELKLEAQDAGCDVVMPRSAFSSNLPNILRRYVDENEDEPNFNTDNAAY
jgi:hypothetical protein